MLSFCTEEAFHPFRSFPQTLMLPKLAFPRSPISTSLSHFLNEKDQPSRNFSSSLFKNYKSQRPNSKKKKNIYIYIYIWVFLRFLHRPKLCLAAWNKLGFSLSRDHTSVLRRPSLARRIDPS